MFNPYPNLNLSRSSSNISDPGNSGVSPISRNSGNYPGSLNAAPYLAQARGALAGRDISVSSPRTQAQAGQAVRNNLTLELREFDGNAARDCFGEFSPRTLLSPVHNQWHALHRDRALSGQGLPNFLATPATAASSSNRQHEQDLPQANNAASREYRIPDSPKLEFASFDQEFLAQLGLNNPGRQATGSATPVHHDRRLPILPQDHNVTNADQQRQTRRHAMLSGAQDVSTAGNAPSQGIRELESVVFKNESADSNPYEMNVITGQISRNGQPVTLKHGTSKTNTGNPLSLVGSLLDFFKIVLIALDRQRQKTGNAKMSIAEFQEVARALRGNYNPDTIRRYSGDINRIFRENGIREPIGKGNRTFTLDDQITLAHSGQPAEHQRIATHRLYCRANTQVDNSSLTQTVSGGRPVTANFGNGFTLDLSKGGSLLNDNGDPVKMAVDPTSLAILKEVLKLGKRSVTIEELKRPLSNLRISTQVRAVVSQLNALIRDFRVNGIAAPINLPNYQNTQINRHSDNRTVELTATCKVNYAEPDSVQTDNNLNSIRLEIEPAHQRKRDEKRDRKKMDQPNISSSFDMTDSVSRPAVLSDETMARLESLSRTQRADLLADLTGYGLTSTDVEQHLANFLSGQALDDDENAINVLERLERQTPGVIARAIGKVLRPNPISAANMIVARRR